MEIPHKPEKTAIIPADLIGTKWVGWSKMFCDQIMVEFVDSINCIYTSTPNEYPMTYKVIGGKLQISEIEEAFERRGDMLFHGDFPVFEKVA